MATIDLSNLGAGVMQICFNDTTGGYGDHRNLFMGKIHFQPSASNLDPLCSMDSVDSRNAVYFDVDAAITDREYEAAGRSLFGDELYERMLTLWGENLISASDMVVDDTVFNAAVARLMALPPRKPASRQ